MNYTNAKTTLQHALDNQTTISISKLKNLMSDLNMTLESSDSKEVNYLKNEIKKLRKHIGKLQKENSK
jgi:polyhydroxyalkanoate synthesis regulator phasin